MRAEVDYREIADALNQQNLRPKNAAKYTEASAKDVIRSAVYHDRRTARGLAMYLKEQGHSLRKSRSGSRRRPPSSAAVSGTRSVKLLLVS